MTSTFRAASPASEALPVAARKVSLLLSICLLLALSSCASIGPAIWAIQFWLAQANWSWVIQTQR